MQESFEAGDSESCTFENISKNSMMSIVLDLNGLLLKSCFQPSLLHKSITYASKKHAVQWPRCIQFLKSLLERFNVGIRSTEKEEHVLQMVEGLFK